jgi:hypothetical protein
MSGEDVTTWTGVSVQQDLALVSLLGLTHVERNGHHFIDGMSFAPEHEQRSFVTAHSDLTRSRQVRRAFASPKGNCAMARSAVPASRSPARWISLRCARCRTRPNRRLFGANAML